MSRRIGSASAAVVLQVEKDIKARLKGQHFDFTAMSAISNVYRAGTAVRNHMERTVLAEYDLSWVAFTVLWVLWIWGSQETAHVAERGGRHQGHAHWRHQDALEPKADPAAAAQGRPSARLDRTDGVGRTPH